MTNPGAKAWTQRRHTWEELCTTLGIPPTQAAEHEAAHAVIGLLMDNNLFGTNARNSSISVDPDEIERRGYQGSAGIADIRYGGDAADLIGTCAGEEWDRITQYRDSLSPDAQGRAYGRDRAAIQRLAAKLAGAECAEYPESQPGRRECVDRIEASARRQALEMLSDDMIHATVQAIAELLQSVGTLEGWQLQSILRSQWEQLKAWQNRLSAEVTPEKLT